MSEPKGRGPAWPLGTVTVLAPLLAVTDWFMPNADQLLALTGRRDLGPAIKDVVALGTAAVAVTCGADAGIENLGQQQ